MQLRVEGEGLRRLELSLADLHTQFKKHTVTATLQCSGNRRAELHRLKPIKGLFWDTGAPLAVCQKQVCCRLHCLQQQQQALLP